MRTDDSGLKIDRAGVVGELDFFQRGEDLAPASRHGPGREVGFEVALAGHVVAAENDVLRRRNDRLAVRRREQVAHREHPRPRLVLRRLRQRHVDRHLVAVEVGVERRADQRVNLDRRAFDQADLERLDAEPVQRRRAVEEHDVVLDDLFQHFPDACGSTRSTSRLAALMLWAWP